MVFGGRSKKIFKEVAEVLSLLEIPSRVSNEKELEFYILGFLEGYFAGKYEVVPQAVGITRGKLMRPDIEIEDVAVELKYLKKSSSEIDRGIGQAIKYLDNYSYVILYFYNPNKLKVNINPDNIPKNLGIIVYP